jgi:hypothetical protein
MYAYMTKRLIILLFAGLLAGIMPVAVLATGIELAAVGQAENPVSITVSEQVVSVTGAQGETLEVVSLTGRKVMSVKIDNAVQRIELNIPKGCYILKVGKVVRKIQVR